MVKLSITRFKKENLFKLIPVVLLVLGMLEPFASPTPVNAGLTGYIRLDRLKVSTATGGLICETPNLTHTASNSSVIVTMPTGFTLNTTGANWTATTTNLPTGTSAWPGITAATPTVSGQVVTYTMASNQTLTASTTYCFNFPSSNTLTTPASAGTNETGSTQITDTTSANNEVTSWATATVNGSSAYDSVTVSATVASTFSFSLGANTAALGTLNTTGAPNTATAITATVATNAQSGWNAWIKNTNATSSLISASTSDGICLGGNYPTCTGAAYTTGSGNVHSLSSAAGYGVSAAAGTGSPAIDAAYAGSSTTFGSLDNSKYEPIVSNTGPTSSNTFTLTFGAEASPTNKAASDYADTVYVTAAGKF